MKSRILMCITAMTLFAALAAPVRMAAQHTRYKVFDMGTFGGYQSYLGFSVTNVNKHGTTIGAADISTPDPNFPHCAFPDCFLPHAFVSQNGAAPTDLGTLPGGDLSVAIWISDSGLIVGGSQNGVTDPLIGGEESRAVLWNGGQITDLGTLGGNESVAFAANSANQVVGPAANTIPDQFSMFGFGTQTHAFLWQNGRMQDLGTLGGPDAFAAVINEQGQIAGASYTNSTPNSTTGIPTQDPFLWQNGKMLELGTLGGTLGGANAMNNLGHVAGNSNVAGDLSYHPFLWNGKEMVDLGTFEGTFGNANAISDSDWVVGDANFPGNVIHRAALWRHGEEIRDLGVVGDDKCSTAWAINSKGQIVGASGDCGIAVHAFLWENGHMIDLTRLIRPGIELTYGLTINEAGEIAAVGRRGGALDAGVQHAFLLIPTDENDAAENDVTAQGKSTDVTETATRTRDFRIPGRRTPNH